MVELANLPEECLYLYPGNTETRKVRKLNVRGQIVVYNG